MRWVVLLLLVQVTAAQAQKKDSVALTKDSVVQKNPRERVIWVADLESKRPLKNVMVRLDRREEVVKTEWGGRFILKNDSFQTMKLTHPSYLTRIIDKKEGVPDTIFLLPSGQQLAEVVVVGKAPKMVVSTEDVQKYAAENYTPSGSGGATVNFDFFDLIDFKGRKHRKRAKKMKDLMDKY
jgi:hypothetical protein